MAVLRPLVLVSGEYTELPPGDSIEDLSVGVLDAGSGLNGGGDLSGPVTIAASIAPEASGLIFEGTGNSAKLTDDGVALVLGENALASGTAALFNSQTALNLSDQAIETSEEAIASGAAAQSLIDLSSTATVLQFTAGQPVESGNPVGFNPIGLVEPIRTVLSQTQVSGLNTFTAIGSGNGTATNNNVIYSANSDRYITVGEYNLNSSDCSIQSSRKDGNTFVNGPPTVWDTNSRGNYALVEENNEGNFLIVYQRPSNFRSVVATLDTLTDTWSFGSQVTLADNNTSTTYSALSYNPVQDNYLFCYVYQSALWAQVINTSGNIISRGDPVKMIDSVNAYLNSAYQPDEDKHIVIGRYNSTPRTNYIAAIIVSTSGVTPINETSLPTFLGEEFNGAIPSTVENDIAYGSRYGNNLVAWDQSNDDGWYGTGLDIVSGNQIETGPQVRLQQDYGAQCRLAYSPDGDYFVMNAQPSRSGIYSACSLDKDLNVNTQRGASYYTAWWTTSGDIAYYVNPQIRGICYSETDKVFVGYGYGNFNNNNSTLRLSGYLSICEPVAGVLPYNEYGQNNFVGISQQTVNSGDPVFVRVEGSVDYTNSGLTPGLPAFLDLSASGFTSTEQSKPNTWSGQWNEVGSTLSTNALLFNKSLETTADYTS